MADLLDVLKQKVIGQDKALGKIVPYIEIWQVGLSPTGRPAGVFLLLGSTGAGKTHTVEALAEALHGSTKSLLRIDCGEFQMEHEVAKLIGAPPGYLGHKETQPALTQQRLTAVMSDKCGLSIVLFDEIEKAAPSMQRLLLGVLDRGVLRLGDNAQVDFEKSLIFMTSNLGAREMSQAAVPYGLAPVTDVKRKHASIALAAAKKRFAPEFMNRIDDVIHYNVLTRTDMAVILDQHIFALQDLMARRLGRKALSVVFTRAAKEHLLNLGTSTEYGAREIKRTLHTHVTQRLAKLFLTGDLPISRVLQVGVSNGELVLTPGKQRTAIAA